MNHYADSIILRTYVNMELQTQMIHNWLIKYICRVQNYKTNWRGGIRGSTEMQRSQNWRMLRRKKTEETFQFVRT